MELMNNLMWTSIVLAVLAFMVCKAIGTVYPEWESNNWIDTVMVSTLLSPLVFVPANIISHIWI